MAEIVRHKKTGGLYEVLFRGAVIHSDVPLSDDAPVTICRPASVPRDLAALSAAACPGEWCGRLLMEMTEADSDFCDALVNAYRSGHLVEAPSPTPARQEEGSRGDGLGGRPVPPMAGGIYTASKTRHADRWKALRAEGWPIASTWIDEAGKGETACFTDLWRRCIWEASQADALLLYCEPGDVLKGALVEVGAALGQGVPVYAVGCSEFTFAKAAGWVDCASIDEALERIQTQLTTPLKITIAPGETTAFVQSVTDGIPAMRKALLTPPDLIQAAREAGAEKARDIAEHQRNCLFEFLHGAGVRLGTIDPNVACDAPQLMTAMDAYFDYLQTTPQGEEGSRGEVPDGWALVPREPKPEMLAAFWRTKNRGTLDVEATGEDRSDCAAYRAMLSAAPTPDANSGGEAPGGWQPIDAAPMDTEVEVRAGFMTFRAKLVPEAGMTENEHVCDQWQATREGEHPPCWSEGACWSSNADHCPSMQPEAWRPLSAAPHPSQEKGRGRCRAPHPSNATSQQETHAPCPPPKPR